MTGGLSRPNWRDLFSAGDLLHIGQATERFPNAPRHLADCVFISHAGADQEAIHSELIDPILFKRKGPNGYFLHSSKSGGAEGYKHIVMIALHFCRYAIVVVSRNSRAHPWVTAEVDWLIDHLRPIATYALDGTPPSEVHPSLGAQSKRPLKVSAFDRSGLSALAKWVDRVDPEGTRAARLAP
jgi:hypothetical protein